MSHLKVGSLLKFIVLVFLLFGVVVFGRLTGHSAYAAQTKFPLNWPVAISSDGSHVWIANNRSFIGNNIDTVTELSASNGKFIRLINSPYNYRYGISNPEQVSSNGSQVWVLNGNLYNSAGLATVSDLSASNAAPIHNLSSQAYGFQGSHQLISDKYHLWVYNQTTSSISELSASSSKLIRIIHAPKSYALDIAYIATDGNNLWVMYDAQNTVITEYNSLNGKLMREISLPVNYVNGALAADKNHVWVETAAVTPPNKFIYTISEFNTGTGSLVRNITGSGYGFNFSNDYDLVSDGTHLFAANANNTITEINENSGGLTKYISGAAYHLSFSTDAGGMSSDGTHLWVVNEYSNLVTEINTINGSAAAILQ